MMLATLLLTLTVAVPPALQQPADTTFAVDARGRLDLENHDGDILVRSWDRNAIRIRSEQAERRDLEIDNVGSVVRVEVDRSRRSHGNRRIDFEVTVPRGYGVAIAAHNGDVVLENIGGAVEVENVNGNIILRGGTGRISAESVSGEIIIDDARGSIHAETINRAIRITRSSGDIEAENVNGSIELSDIDSAIVHAESVNGSVQYQGSIRKNGRYTFSSHNGGITMTVPDGTNAAFQITTHSGSIQTDFPVQLRQIESNRSVSFRMGDGGARVELESFGGSIRLRRPGSR